MRAKNNVLAIMMLCTVLLSIGSGIVAASDDGSIMVQEVDVDGLFDPERHEWWSPMWHYRMCIEVDANDYARRWGRLITFNLGLSTFANLDINSIRVVDNVVEIPSEYFPGTDTVMFVVNETLGPEDTKKYWVYYDKMTNGVKHVPDYGYDYIRDYIMTIQEYENYQLEHDAAESEYFSQFQIQEVEGAHVLRGETVVQYPDGNWYYLNGTQADHYIEGDGQFFYYNGEQVYADDQGNWYYMDGSRLTYALYFDDGEYYWYFDQYTTFKVLPDGSGGWRFALDPLYPEGIPDADLIIINPITDYYYTIILNRLLGNPLDIPTVIYRDQVTGIWYYYNNSVMEGWYDPVDREFYYNGNYIYQEADGDWVFDTEEGTIGFASEINDIYFYQDQQIYLDDGGTPEDPTDDMWLYMQDGTEVLGYAYEDQATGEWVVYVGKILEELNLIDGTLWYEDEFIVYNEVTGKWEFLNGAEVLGVVDPMNKVYMMGDDIVYYNNAESKWYYEDGTGVRGTMTYDPLTETYTFFYNGIERAIYEADGIVYYWNGEEWHEYGPVEINDIDFYVGGQWYSSCPEETVVDIIASEPSIRTIESTSAWELIIDTASGTYTKEITNTIWRDVPDIDVSMSSNSPFSYTAHGSSIFNLNASITIGEVEYNAMNISEYIDDVIADFNSLGIDIGGDVQGALDGGDIESAFSMGSSVVLLSECDPIDVQDLDWDNDAYDMSGIYSTGKTYEAGEKLEVIPILIQSRYIGVYDVVEQSGYALATTDDILVNNILVEAWKETLLDDVYYYYVNVSFNAVRWWYTAPEGVSSHIVFPDEFTLKEIFLDGSGDADPETTIIDALGDIPDVIVTKECDEQSVPISIGTIIIPLKVKPDTNCPITVGISGETIASVQYKINDDPTLYDFDSVEPFYINNVEISHEGLRASVVEQFTTTGSVKITVVATDSNLSVHTKSVTITVSQRASVIFTWIAVIMASVTGILGFAVISNKKHGRNASGVSLDCLDGKCDL